MPNEGTRSGLGPRPDAAHPGSACPLIGSRYQAWTWLGHRSEVAADLIRASGAANAFAARRPSVVVTVAAAVALTGGMSLARHGSLNSFVHGRKRDTDAVAAAIGTS